MEIKALSLDDLLNPQDLAALKAKRKAKSTVDLSDLLPKKNLPPPIEVLEAVQVQFVSQQNTCLNCQSSVNWPLGLVAMHKIKRHGRSTQELIGIALTDCNQHPHLERVHHTTQSYSIVCAHCVDEARFIQKPMRPIPVPLSPEWYDQHRCALQEDVHKIEESKRRAAETLQREIGDEGGRPIDSTDLALDMAREIQTRIAMQAVLDEEPTRAEDTQ